MIDKLVNNGLLKVLKPTKKESKLQLLELLTLLLSKKVKLYNLKLKKN